MRKSGSKNVTRALTGSQAERYQSWFENNRRLKELVEELQHLSVEAINEAEGWQDADASEPIRDAPENVSAKGHKRR